MKLTSEQIRPLVGGCEQVVEERGGWRFERLPEPLAERYRPGEGSRVRLECTSAVRLRFVTDARSMRIGLRYGAAARAHYCGALAADGGEPVAFGPTAAAESWQGEVPLTGQVFEVWLPHLVKTELTHFELIGASRVAPAPVQRARWLALGDSITQGMTVPLPTQMAIVQTARALDLDVRNFGIGGAALEAWLAEAELAWPFELLTIAYGTNDFNRGLPVADFAAQARTLLTRQAAAHPRARLVAITPLPWVGRATPSPLGDSLDAYRQALAAVAAEFPGVQLLHGPELVPDDSGMFVDNVHPNVPGMNAYARHLTASLRPLLTQPA